MSKLYDKYLVLKAKQTTNTMYLFKAGIFYIFIDKDAVVMSEVLKLKLGHLNKDIYKCGFPSNNFNKYSELLKKHNVNYIIIDEGLDQIASTDAYINNIYIKDIINKLKEVDLDDCSPRDAYEFLYNMKLIADRIDEV